MAPRFKSCPAEMLSTANTPVDEVTVAAIADDRHHYRRAWLVRTRNAPAAAPAPELTPQKIPSRTASSRMVFFGITLMNIQHLIHQRSVHMPAYIPQTSGEFPEYCCPLPAAGQR